MRKVINEPGFWMMVFTVVILAMFLFAGKADCQEMRTGLRYMVEVQKVSDGWSAGINFRPLIEPTTQRVVYHHYIQAERQQPLFLFTTEYPPTMRTLIQAIHVFEGRRGE